MATLNQVIPGLQDSSLMHSIRLWWVDNPIDQADNKHNRTGEFVIYKSHYPEQCKPDYITGSSKIVYVVRDFRDVLVSGFFLITDVQVNINIR